MLFLNKQFLTLIILIFFGLNVFSQETRVPASMKTDPTCNSQNCRLLQYFNNTVISKGCGTAFFFTRFTISPQGNVQKVECSNGTSPFMQDLIAKCLAATNGFWNPEKLNGVAVESKTFLLPVMYSFPKQCPESLDTTIIANGKMYKARPIEFEYPDYSTQPGYSLLHMLDFSTEFDKSPAFPNSKIFPLFDGYVLSPIFLKKDEHH